MAYKLTFPFEADTKVIQDALVKAKSTAEKVRNLLYLQKDTIDHEYATRLVNSVDIAQDLWASLVCGLSANSTEVLDPDSFCPCGCLAEVKPGHCCSCGPVNQTSSYD
jgi:hypothetical protein